MATLASLNKKLITITAKAEEAKEAIEYEIESLNEEKDEIIDGLADLE